MAAENDFLGMGWSFPPTFLRKGRDLEMTSGREDIERSLEILLSTTVGERVMQPRYGCNLDRLLFEPIDAALQAYVEDLIRVAILYFEARIILDDVKVVPQHNEGRLDIDIAYRLTTTNTRYNYVYPFYLEEGVGMPVIAGKEAAA